MHVSAKADYAVRALLELAVADSGPLKGDEIGERQSIPLKFLENILAELRRAGMVGSQRGASGGYWLVRDPAELTVAEVIRAVEGPLAAVRGMRPDDVHYEGVAAPLQDVWIAVRASLRSVLEKVTIADIAKRSLPKPVMKLVNDPESWRVP